jgi:hydrogenase nickel incorporation protein HypB
MCTDCGCSNGAKATVTNLKPGSAGGLWRSIIHRLHERGYIYDQTLADDDGGHHHHHHGHDHAHHHHHHEHDHGHTVVELQQSVLAKNDALAERNRAWLAGREVLMLNLVSSPGAGKTSLLERTIRDLNGRIAISVIEGDQATAHDGERIIAAGAPAVQVNTGTGCHLEADMVHRGLGELKPKPGSIVMVENVGNLVCPALFDLGERAKVAILSVTEGEDKPLKYPHMFRAAKLILMNKTDLLPHVDFDLARAIAYARDVNPDVEIIQTSARTGAGMDAWYNWLGKNLEQAGIQTQP